MNQITNNPYRIIGILAGAGLREKTKRISRLKMLIDAAEDESDDFSFQIIDKFERTKESLESAVSGLDLDEDKLTAALFWFCDKGVADESALNMLKENNVEGAIEIWNKLTSSGNISKSNFSAYLNLSSLSLWKAFKGEDIDKDLLKNGIELKLKFLESDFHDEILKISADENFKIKKAEVQKIFLSKIYEDVIKFGNGSEKEFWNILKDIEFTAKPDFEKKVIGEVIEKIEKRVSDASSAKKQDVTKSIVIGNKLIDNTEENLLKVKNILGEDESKYKNICDKVSNEASQCAIQYFNHFRETDFDPGEESEKLFLRAKEIAKGKITQQRLEDNWLVINEWNNESESRAKYKSTSHLVDKINTELDYFNSNKKNLNAVFSLIDNCKPILIEIGYELGFNDKKYIFLSTNIAREAQNYLVEMFNKIFDELNKHKLFIDYSLIRNSLYDVHKGMLNVSILDLDEDFQDNTFSPNFSAFREACSQAGVQTMSEYGFKKLSQSHIRRKTPSKKQIDSSISKNVQTHKSKDKHLAFFVAFLLIALIFIIFKLSSNNKTEEKTKTLTEKEISKNSFGDVVNLETNMGKIKIKLFSKEAPIATDNFKKFIVKEYFDSIYFDDEVNSKFIKLKYPAIASNAYKLKNDDTKSKIKHNKLGLVSVQNYEKDHIFPEIIITLSPFNKINDKYTVIGEVIEGMDIVKNIASNRKYKNIAKTKNVTITNK